MCIFTAIFLCVFITLYISMYNSSYNSSMETLRKVADADGRIMFGQGADFHSGTAGPDGEMSELPRFPDGGRVNRFEGYNTISVKYNTDGSIYAVLSVVELNIDIEQLNASKLAQIISAGSKSGTVALGGVSYRYLNAEKSYGGIIVLADRAEEKATLNNLIRLSLVIGLAGLTVLFIISIILSGWAVKPIQTAWDKQRQFVADASHELKTPLTVINANIDVIEANSQDTVEGQRKWFDYIRSETERMEKLVGDLLVLARIDAAEARSSDVKQKNKTDPVCLSDIFEDVCLSMESVIYESGRSFSTEAEPEIRVKGDKNELRRLIVILIDNALKHSPNGASIRVSLKKVRGEAVLTCLNTGDPIPPDKLGRIFERFYRADDSHNSSTGGSGLGLAIGKAITEASGGEIKAENLPGEVMFTLRLPAE